MHQHQLTFAGMLGFMLLVLTCVVGCDNDGLIPVTGTVTFDGEPIQEGSISFMPLSGEGVTAGGIITNGKYSARLSPGEMAVQIDASKEVRKENPTKEEIERGIDVSRVSYIPTKYNRQSELKATITEAGNNLNFDLERVLKLPET